MHADPAQESAHDRHAPPATGAARLFDLPLPGVGGPHTQNGPSQLPAARPDPGACSSLPIRLSVPPFTAPVSPFVELSKADGAQE